MVRIARLQETFRGRMVSSSAVFRLLFEQVSTCLSCGAKSFIAEKKWCIGLYIITNDLKQRKLKNGQTQRHRL